MPDPNDPSLAVVFKVACGLIGWVAFRLESYGTRIVRLEEKLQNGLVTAVAELRQEHRELKQIVQDHVNGEEERILRLGGLSGRRRSARKGEMDDA